MSRIISSKKSKILNQNISLLDDGSIICQDNTEYSKSEIRLLHGISDNWKRVVHKVKFLFGGEVVDYVE